MAMLYERAVHTSKIFLVMNVFILCLLLLKSAEGRSGVTLNNVQAGAPLSGQFAQPETEEKRTPEAANDTKSAEGKTEPATKESKICTSPYCHRIADIIEKSINEEVKPCTDFYEYACGKWIKTHEVPKHHSQFSRITQLSNDNEDKILEALKEDKSTDSETVMKVKNFYRSCMEETTIDELGRKPLLDYITSLGSWALNDTWTAPKWEFHQVLRHIQKNYAVDVFFDLDTIPDPTEKKSKHILMVGDLHS